MSEFVKDRREKRAERKRERAEQRAKKAEAEARKYYRRSFYGYTVYPGKILLRAYTANT